MRNGWHELRVRNGPGMRNGWHGLRVRNGLGMRGTVIEIGIQYWQKTVIFYEPFEYMLQFYRDNAYPSLPQIRETIAVSKFLSFIEQVP